MPGIRQTTRVATARGFTVVELLVVIAVVSILLSVALPSYRSIVLDSARAAAVNDLVAALALARAEAQKQHRQVVVCPMHAGSCAPDRANWNDGWLVYVDLDGGVTPSFDADDPVIAIFERRSPRVTIRGSARQLAFRPTPRRGLGGSVSFCDARGAAHARQVVVAPSGRVRTSAGDVPCA